MGLSLRPYPEEPSLRRFASLLLISTLSVALLGLQATPTAALPRGTHVQTYRGNLNFPVDMAWLPGSRRIFFTEKNSGRIRVMKGPRLLSKPCVNLDVDSSGESGALGIVLHPRFRDNHFLYVYWTKDSPRTNRVTRFKVEDNRCRNPKVIISGIPSGGYHNGGQLEFVDGKLFISTGEAHDPGLAQNRNNRVGKVLRLNPDGSTPLSNPFSDPGDRNPVWSYGHRNPFGLTHKPGSKKLYETENGPECDDELNKIVKGRNYGWGDGYQCGTRGVGPNPKGPLVRWSNIIVPTDPWWYVGRMGSLSGDLYVGGYGDGKLHRYDLNAKGTRVVDRRVVYEGAGILDVSKGPRGWLYFLTDHSIRRIVPNN